MADITFNVALGRAAAYGGLTAANDALVGVVLDNSGLESDATLKDYDTLAAILAASNNEHSTLTRKTPLAGVTVTVDDSTNTTKVDATDITWTTPSAGALTGKLLICYDDDTTGGSDTNLIPLVGLDFAVTPSGSGDVTYQFDADGFFNAS